MSASIDSSFSVKGAFEPLPHTNASTFIFKKENVLKGDLSCDRAFFYISKIALEALENTKGEEVVIRPVHPCDNEFLVDSGPIKRESRLAIINIYPSGKMALALRHDLIEKLAKTLKQPYFKKVKIQTWRGEEISIDVLKNIKSLERLDEESYLETARQFNQLLASAIEIRKQLAQKKS